VDNIDQQQMNGITIRRLAAQDFDAVVGMDATAVGHPRTTYFERRLKTAKARPALYVQFGAEQNGKLVGFMMARQTQGQFGRNESALRLEAFAVASDVRGQHIGSALLSKLEDEAKRLKIAQIRTTASWRDHSIMQFLDHAGFELGSELVLDSHVTDQRLAVHEGKNSEALARDKMDLSTLKPDDLYDVVRIDKGVTGERREAFFYEMVDEAMKDSAVRVSLVARVDGIAAGFVMARTSFGDFGRTEPVAVLDTIGVDPDYSRRGIGHALLSQLFANLDGLRVEWVETVVANRDFRLLGFFYDIGFKPSQRLVFVKRLG
jgi:predicted N-acetyltransferase YhbS